eukprot:g48117.t1
MYTSSFVRICADLLSQRLHKKPCRRRAPIPRAEAGENMHVSLQPLYSPAHPMSTPAEPQPKRSKLEKLRAPLRAVSFTALPNAIICYVFSFLDIQEHYTILGRLSNSLASLLFRRSAWCLDKLEFDHELYDQPSVDGLEGMPDHILARLGRLGFDSIEYTAPVTSFESPDKLGLLANSKTKALLLEGFSIAGDELKPLQKMRSLEKLELRHCSNSRGLTDQGLTYLQGLQLKHLVISRSNHRQFDAILSTGPLKNGDLANVLPYGLDLFEELVLNVQDLRDSILNVIGLFGRLQKLSLTTGLACLAQAWARWPVSATQQNLAYMVVTTIWPLSQLPVSKSLFCNSARLSQNHRLCFCRAPPIDNAGLSNLSCLPLKDLCLRGCENIRGPSLLALSAIRTLSDVDLSETELEDNSRFGLSGLQLKTLDLHECQELTDLSMPLLAVELPALRKLCAWL